MKMRVKTLAAAVALGCVMSATASAAEIYGKMHMSIDSSKDGVADSKTSISSNSSRIGFKGEHDTGGVMTVVWQIELGMDPDIAKYGSSFRNTYAGFKTSHGTMVFGHHDTPYKSLGVAWNVFDDSVGGQRAMLGASSQDQNQLNQRAKNAALYTHTFAGVAVQAMYATDAEDTSGGSVDAPDEMYSVSAATKVAGLSLSGAYVNWDSRDGIDSLNGTRVAASYDLGDVELGVIYEVTDTTDSASKQWNRNVMGANAVYNRGARSFRIQYLQASSSDLAGDDSASKLSVGVFQELDKQTSVYLAYGATTNAATAQFNAVDGGHGDEVVASAAGKSPSAMSMGMIYKF